MSQYSSTQKNAVAEDSTTRQIIYAILGEVYVY